MPTSSFPQLDEYKIRAQRLLKDLNGADQALALAAATRLVVAAHWASGKPETLIGSARVQRKHALAAIAIEAGYSDWAQLKQALQGSAAPLDTARLFADGSASYLNLWCRSHEEARAMMRDDPPRYLFPYGRQFVVCEAPKLQSLGLDMDDPDWELIGRDWAEPLDRAAHERLSAKLHSILPQAAVRATRTKRV